MVRCRSSNNISASKPNLKDDVPAETTPTETDVSKPVMVDLPEKLSVSQSENEMQTTLEQVESQNLAIIAASFEAKENKVDAAEEEIMVGQAAEGLGGGGEEGCGDDDVDVGDDDDDVHDANNYDDAGDDEEDDCNDDDDDGEEEDMMDEEDDCNDDIVDGDDNYGREEDMIVEEELGECAKEETKDNAAQEDKDYQENVVEAEIKEETEKEENEKRGGRSLKQKVEPSTKGIKRKKVLKGSSDKVASKGEDNQEEGRQDDASKEEDAQKEIERKGGGSSMQNVRKLRQGSRRKKVTSGGFEKVVIKQDYKPESQSKKKSSQRAASMGMIFMCNSETKADCFRYKILGLPGGKRDIVGKIYKGMRLFMYDVDLKLMYGIYKAAGRGGFNIQPKAFNSQFPSQVRFTVLEDCLPLAEEKFKKVIKDNYFTRTKFDCQLTSKQVKNLCKLFLATSKGPKSRKLGRSVGAHNHTSANRDRSRAQLKERRSVLEGSRYHEYPHGREREVVLRLPPLPPRANSPSYLYDTTLEMDAYRRNQHRELVLEPRDAYRPAPVLEHRDVYRLEPLSSYFDSYRRDVEVEPRDLCFQDEIGTNDPYISYRERRGLRDPQFRDEIRRHDQYTPYREHVDPQSQEEIRRHDPYTPYREHGDPQSRDEIRRHDLYTSYREHGAYRDNLYARRPLTERVHHRYRSAQSLYRH